MFLFASFSFPVQQPKSKHHKIISGRTKMFFPKIKQDFFGRFSIFYELVKSKQFRNNVPWICKNDLYKENLTRASGLREQMQYHACWQICSCFSSFWWWLFQNCWQHVIFKYHVISCYFTVLNKVYQRKTLLFFWTSTNLNLRNDKGKHSCFASALREQMQILSCLLTSL